MRSKSLVLLLCALLSVPAAAQYKVALPGYRYEFPRDHFNHPEFQTEWWYYTGNLKAANGREYGFELTFFRAGVSRSQEAKTAWGVQDIYLAHLALTDIANQKFYHRERLNRPSFGLAGADGATEKMWNGNWQVQLHGNVHELRAVSDSFKLQLTLRADKSPVINGLNGISQKAEGPGKASHYISVTRLATSGSIELGGATIQVNGSSWMDHEFFTHQLQSAQIGWDWFSLQLSDNTELMLFRLRRRDGTADAFSSGTYVDAEGKAVHLGAQDFTLLHQAETWTSAVTGAFYPVEWKIALASLRIFLTIKTPLPQQEITASSHVGPNYWEGAIRIDGTRNGAPIKGVGYLEMTGYDKAVNFDPRN